jgi:hypothetical protein
MDHRVGLLLGLALLGCQTCNACTPGTPAPPDTDPLEETGETGETADTQETADTSPPPPCAFPEEEPNYNFDEANLIQMEQYACGAFGTAYDFDVFEFEAPAGWIEVDVDASERGSPAEPIMLMEQLDGEAVAVPDSALSSDPWVVLYADEPATWFVALTQGASFGDDMTYRFMALQTKAPVVWDVDEGDNHTAADAMPLDWGERVMGRADSNTLSDWYRIEIPDQGDDKVTLRFEVDAQRLGSPLDARFNLYRGTDDPELDADGDGVSDTRFRGATNDPETSSRDPITEYTTSGDEVVYVMIRHMSGEGYGPHYWYTFLVSEVVEEDG